MSDESSTDREIRHESDEQDRAPLSRGAALSVLVFDVEEDDDTAQA